jgi:hypothetical protein
LLAPDNRDKHTGNYRYKLQIAGILFLPSYVPRKREEKVKAEKLAGKKENFISL